MVFIATMVAMVLMRSVPIFMMARSRLVTSPRAPKSAEFARRSNSAENDGSIFTRPPISETAMSSLPTIARIRWATAGKGGTSRSAHGACGRARNSVMTHPTNVIGQNPARLSGESRETDAISTWCTLKLLVEVGLLE